MFILSDRVGFRTSIQNIWEFSIFFGVERVLLSNSISILVVFSQNSKNCIIFHCDMAFRITIAETILNSDIRAFAAKSTHVGFKHKCFGSSRAGWNFRMVGSDKNFVSDAQLPVGIPIYGLARRNQGINKLRQKNLASPNWYHKTEHFKNMFEVDQQRTCHAPY